MVLSLLQGLFEPFHFLLFSASYIPSTIAQLVRSGDWGTLFSWSKFSDAWFANFWSYAGPLVRTGAEARVVPLLQGRVRAGIVVPPEDAVSPGVGGTVIEVGPGSGMWVSIFSDKYVSQANGDAKGSAAGLGVRTRVDKVFGIEPNPDQHPALRRRVVEAGLEGRYEVVPVGIEDIATTGLVQPGTVDAIVTVLCLCSIPDQEKNIRALYDYLKPGGRWYVYEHVRTRPAQGAWIGMYQSESAVLEERLTSIYDLLV